MKSLVLVCCLVATVHCEKDGWVWKDNEQKSGADKRYLVNENLEDFDERPLPGYRPQNVGPYGPNSRPIVPASYPGNKGSPPVLVGPGGPTGVIKRPPYNGGIDDGPLNSGLVPSWVRDDPRYREYDVCRCRYSFNCPSTGLKFCTLCGERRWASWEYGAQMGLQGSRTRWTGSCSAEKQYCCFSSRKYPALASGQYGGGSYPSNSGYPNKYGPASFAQTPNYYGNRRPPGSFYPGNRYPPGNYPNPGQNVNPYPRPQGNLYGSNYDYDDFDLFSRSLRKNQTEAETNEKA